MSAYVQFVELFLERGDLESCESTHIVAITQNDITGRMEANIKSSTAHPGVGDRNITGELTRTIERTVINIGLAQYERAISQGAQFDWDERDLA